MMADQARSHGHGSFQVDTHDPVLTGRTAPLVAVLTIVALGALLTAKYAELVVDEAQDCSAADLYILNRLRDANVPLVIVADPDQAIYGFRGAATQELTRLAERLGRHDPQLAQHDHHLRSGSDTARRPPHGVSPTPPSLTTTTTPTQYSSTPAATMTRSQPIS
jgi:hypothetical protein